jgi:hypothetical protein
MNRLSQDPFLCPLLPRFRTFEISIVHGGPSASDATDDFVTTLKAIHVVQPPPAVPVPPRAEFFDWDTVSDFELRFPFARDALYKDARNFMVAAYRIFSSHYLPFTLCRRNIKAPAHLTLQIWTFLKRYGLINSRIDARTKPSAMVPSFDHWPQLIYTVNDRFYTLEQFERRLHPVPGPVPAPGSTVSLMACPFIAPGRTRQSAEVPGLMSFGAWTADEMAHLEKQLAPDAGASWEALAPARKSAHAVADQIAMLPFSNTAGIEKGAHAVAEADDPAVLRQELPTGPQAMRELALAAAPGLRLIARAVHAAGAGNARALLKGELPDLPCDAEQAAGLLAMERVAGNVARVKAMHKQRILQCMDAVVGVMKQVILAKKNAVDQAKVDRARGRNPSESELSSDEKGWQSSTEDAP